MDKATKHGATESADLKKKLKRGFLVFGILAIIEFVEFAIGVGMPKNNWLVLTPFAFIGAWPIVQYFMHIGHIRRHNPEE